MVQVVQSGQRSQWTHSPSPHPRRSPVRRCSSLRLRQRIFPLHPPTPVGVPPLLLLEASEAWEAREEEGKRKRNPLWRVCSVGSGRLRVALRGRGRGWRRGGWVGVGLRRVTIIIKKKENDASTSMFWFWFRLFCAERSLVSRSLLRRRERRVVVSLLLRSSLFPPPLLPFSPHLFASPSSTCFSTFSPHPFAFVLYLRFDSLFLHPART